MPSAVAGPHRRGWGSLLGAGVPSAPGRELKGDPRRQDTRKTPPERAARAYLGRRTFSLSLIFRMELFPGFRG